MPISRCASADSPAPKTRSTYFCPSTDVVRVQQRRAEQVRVGEVVAEHLLARLQQRDELLVLPGLQVAVGEDQVGVLRLGLGRDDPLQLRDRLVRARRLVVREREIQADGVVRRVDLQRRLVLRDRVVELPEPDVGRAEVRERVGAIGAMASAAL